MKGGMLMKERLRKWMVESMFCDVMPIFAGIPIILGVCILGTNFAGLFGTHAMLKLVMGWSLILIGTGMLLWWFAWFYLAEFLSWPKRVINIIDGFLYAGLSILAMLMGFQELPVYIGIPLVILSGGIIAMLDNHTINSRSNSSSSSK